MAIVDAQGNPVKPKPKPKPKRVRAKTPRTPPPAETPPPKPAPEVGGSEKPPKGIIRRAPGAALDAIKRAPGAVARGTAKVGRIAARTGPLGVLALAGEEIGRAGQDVGERLMNRDLPDAPRVAPDESGPRDRLGRAFHERRHGLQATSPVVAADPAVRAEMSQAMQAEAARAEAAGDPDRANRLRFADQVQTNPSSTQLARPGVRTHSAIMGGIEAGMSGGNVGQAMYDRSTTAQALNFDFGKIARSAVDARTPRLQPGLAASPHPRPSELGGSTSVVPGANSTGQDSVGNVDPELQRIATRIQSGGNATAMPQNTGFIRNERTGDMRVIDQRGGNTRISGQASAPANIPTSFRRSLGAGTPQSVSRQSGGGATLPRISRNNFAAGAILAGTNRMLERQDDRAESARIRKANEGKLKPADINAAASALNAQTNASRLDNSKMESLIADLSGEDPRKRSLAADRVYLEAQSSKNPQMEQLARIQLTDKLGQMAGDFGTFFGPGRGPVQAFEDFRKGRSPGLTGTFAKWKIDDNSIINSQGRNLGDVSRLNDRERTMLQMLIERDSQAAQAVQAQQE